jgi:hypothetical protein
VAVYALVVLRGFGLNEVRPIGVVGIGKGSGHCLGIGR